MNISLYFVFFLYIILYIISFFLFYVCVLFLLTQPKRKMDLGSFKLFPS